MSNDELLLTDPDGQLYRVPRAIIAPYARPIGELRELIAQASKVDLSKIPADLRDQWQQAQAEVPDVEGQADPALIGFLIVIKLGFLAFRIMAANRD